MTASGVQVGSPTVAGFPSVLARRMAVIGLQSWYSLVRRQGLDDEQAIDLIVGMVCCLVDGE